jgi:murein tripeptide amidase MpaA
VLIDDVQNVIDEQLKESRQFRLGTFNNERMSFEQVFSDYQDADVYTEFLLGLPGAKPVVVGQSYQNRSIIGIQFGSGTDNVVLQGGIHAREWISPSTATFVAYSLLTDPTETKLLQRFRFTIIPVLNVDGYSHTRSRKGDRLWRKNRQPTFSDRCIGTDLNRNYGFKWESSIFAQPCSETYPGPSAFSAPETKTTTDYIRKLGKLVSFVDLHSFTQKWMFPWGYTCGQHVPEFKALQEISARAVQAVKEVNGLEFVSGDICDTIYKAAGSTVDWAYGTENAVFSFGIELRDDGRYGFLLPASQILPAVREAWAGLKEMWTLAGEYLDNASK